MKKTISYIYNLAVAYVTGISLSESQRQGLKAGLSLKEALYLADMVKLEAYKAGLPIEDAIWFQHIAQVEAYKVGIPVEEALQFQYIPQVWAYKHGYTITDALKAESINYWQERALQKGMPIDDVLKFRPGEPLTSFSRSTVDLVSKASFQLKML